MKHTDSEDVPEKTREDCAPGAPHISFLSEPRLALVLSNPVPRSGLFTLTLGVADGDTVEKVKARLAKEVKAIKGKL